MKEITKEKETPLPESIEETQQPESVEEAQPSKRVEVKTVTFGVRGLIEWHVKIRYDELEIPVSFTGGTVTGFGVRPATFTTDDPFIQHVIRKSLFYKEGKIIEC